MTEQERVSLLYKCGRVFSPAAPINSLDLFRGRKDQLTQVVGAISTRGMHVVLYGDRGVGKTSLANILKEALETHTSVEIVKVNCNKADTYPDTWRRALHEVSHIVSEKDEEGKLSSTEYTLDQWMDYYEGRIGSGELKKILSYKCNEHHQLIIIFDEYDRLAPDHRKRFADAIKDLADSSINATLILIGVATSVTDLIDEHKSIERNLRQVVMPPMADFELMQIIDKGIKALGMKAETEVKQIIISLSRGYPYYTHLLCLHTATKAINMGTTFIKTADLSEAIKISLDNALASVKEDYAKASQGQRKGTTYPLLLLACALADNNDQGCFRPVDVKAIENGTVKERSSTSDCSEQLINLATNETRGYVLERFGTPRKYKYRFRNPLLKPYIIMRGLMDKTIDGVLIDMLCGTASQPKNTARSLFSAQEASDSTSQ